MSTVIALLLALHASATPEIFFQAHRGGLEEVPENTFTAMDLAWQIPGAVPEVDLQTTADGVIVLLHDKTPARTTNAPAPWDKTPIREIPLAQTREWDAGIRFAPSFTGTKIPTLDELFAQMRPHPERNIYLDLKDVDLPQLKRQIDAAGLGPRILFVHGNPKMCQTLTEMFPGARTMTWLSGPPATIRARYAALREEGFAGIAQLQFHLQVAETGPPIQYTLDDDFLRDAARELRALGKELQLRPFAFDHASLHRLHALGINWFVTDAPAAFYRAWRGETTTGEAPKK